jgi:hypothetical protein
MRTPEPGPGLRRPWAALAYEEAGDASVLGAEDDSVVDWLGAEDDSVVDWLAGALVLVPPLLVVLLLPLLPQAAALSAAAPRTSARRVFRMVTSFRRCLGGTDLGGPSDDPLGRGGTAPTQGTLGEPSRRPGGIRLGPALRLTRNQGRASALIWRHPAAFAGADAASGIVPTSPPAARTTARLAITECPP